MFKRIDLLREVSINLGSLSTVLGFISAYLLGSGQVGLGVGLFILYLLLGNIGDRLYWILIAQINKGE